MLLPTVLEEQKIKTKEMVEDLKMLDGAAYDGGSGGV